MSVPRNRLVLVVLAVVLGGVGLSSCTGGQALIRDYGNPTATDKKDYYDDFMFGCTGVEPVKGTNRYLDPVLASSDYCNCVYKGLKARVPFSEAKAFEEAQAKATKQPDGTYDITIPKNIQVVMASCDSKK